MPSNLPPGVNESDIPGNRPEDAYWEKVLDGFYNSLDEKTKPALLKIGFKEGEEVIEKAIQYGINLGRDEARQEQAERHHYCSEEIWDALETFQNKLERYLERR